MLMMNADVQGVRRAAGTLAEGGLVAFPTETVYGLGGDAENDHAVARIFAVKGRPSFNPLIVHVPTRTLAEEYGLFTPLAVRLADAFWPGPLTLVLRHMATCRVSRLASAGLETVALRLPAHAEAQALLAAFGRGIAAPSANRSGRLSPTRAAHVQAEYAACEPSPDLLLAGADCTVGLESTILDATGEEAIILRPGSITPEMLQAAGCAARLYAGSGIEAPGMLSSHYAPRLPLRLHATDAREGEGMLGFGTCAPASAHTLNLSPSGDLVEAAANLFAFLHRLDALPLRAIAVAPIPEEGIGLAIHDRLRRAAAPRA
jgi:L-threonylcarbamoyladenylate synthase